jgi:1,4-alpha-glucan branching enzyme
VKLNVSELGPRVKGDSVTFRLVLPNMDPEARVLAIGTFCDWDTEKAVSLRYNSKNEQWEGTLEELENGEYEYAYVVKTGSWYSNPSNDPYARLTGENGLSAFRIPADKPARLDSFKCPKINDLVAYELELDNFNFDFEGVKKRVVNYLSQLGVNALIISPWVGYDHGLANEKVPVHFFAPDSVYGDIYELKVMINECHRAGIAVIMDLDLHGVSPDFGFSQMYPIFENKPMLGRLDDTGKRIHFNYSDEFTRNFVFEACRWWLDEYNIDGIRFLNVKDYWDGPNGEGFADVCKRIYEMKKRDGEQVFLFAKDCSHADSVVLNKSYANGIDNRHFFQYIHRMAENRTLNTDFWKTMDINQLHFNDETVIDDNKTRNVILNAIENPDQHSLIVKMGVISNERDVLGYPVGDRKNHWWKVKPYVIAQFTATGIPVIFNGQEICDNRFVPEAGPEKFAPMPLGWHYLTDFAGKDMFRFHQKMIVLRNKFKSLKGYNFFHYFSDPELQVVAFKRYIDQEALVIAINFSNESSEVILPFPQDGYWHEYLDDYHVAVIDRKAVVKVPARYGVIFYKKD